MPPPAPTGLVIAAFAAIYLIWGSTYLAIRFAVETMPPFMMGGARFLLAGGGLYLWLRTRGAPNPTPAQWSNALIVGSLLLGIGNGGVNWAEQTVPSSLVALLIAVTPLWFALLDWLRPGGTRPKRSTAVGLVIGFGGMILLVGPMGDLEQARIRPAGLVALLAASIAWASGSLYARYTPKPSIPMMGGALQMLAGGVALCLTGLIMGEAADFSIHRVSGRSLGAFAYLTLVGSLVGFTAYSWLLKVSTPARVSTYAYVNPVIALFLGCAWGGERLTMRDWTAAAVILLGVVIINTRPSR
ncbi:MAG: drug/metabolite exporter YedA [Verrucomicrobiota bacterium]